MNSSKKQLENLKEKINHLQQDKEKKSVLKKIVGLVLGLR
jgi:hypothetical protein